MLPEQREQNAPVHSDHFPSQKCLIVGILRREICCHYAAFFVLKNHHKLCYNDWTDH